MPRDLTEQEAWAYWTAPDREAFVAEEDGRILGAYFLRANHPGGGGHVANPGYMTAADSAGRGVGRSCASIRSTEPARKASLIPGLLTLTATQLKLQGRANWHYRKRDRLEGLLRQIKYKTPQFPTGEQIAALADELTEINRSMAAEWEQNLGFDPGPTDRR